MDEVIITSAITGSAPTKEQNPNLPITPEEIADSAVEAWEAGASIVHIHVRDPETQASSNDPALFTRVVDRIRSKCDVILNLSTGHGGRLYVPPNGKMTGTDGHIIKEYVGIQTPEERVEHVLQLKPEFCSLDIGSMNFGAGIFINAPGLVDTMAELIRDAGVKPEIELFDFGHLETAQKLIRNGLIAGKPHYQLCMGTAGGISATAKNAVQFADCLPDDCTWSMFGVGRTQFLMVAMGVLLDGHVRVGFEDNLYLSKGVKAGSNAELVERAVAIIHNLNKKVATVEDTRSILQL